MSPDHHPPRIPDQDVHRAVRGAMYVAPHMALRRAVPADVRVEVSTSDAASVYGAVYRVVMEEVRRDPR